jgi:hypothetical protein
VSKIIERSFPVRRKAEKNRHTCGGILQRKLVLKTIQYPDSIPVYTAMDIRSVEAASVLN